MNAMANIIAALSGKNAMGVIQNSGAGMAAERTILSQEYDDMVGQGVEMPPKAEWLRMRMLQSRQPEPQAMGAQTSY